jgi:hypothetical protein
MWRAYGSMSSQYAVGAGTSRPRSYAAPRAQGMGGVETLETGLSDHAQPLARFPDSRVLLLTATEDIKGIQNVPR